MAKAHPFTMTIDMSVLESLGINLYSNAAAVLSELVANAYDADATFVEIEWKPQESTVIVTDDGVGMTQDQLDERFLTTGYQKRQIEGTHSERWNRPFMGRKGIGKLSIFSIAEEVNVYSTKGGVSTGCRIVADDLTTSIKEREDYHPEPVPVPEEYTKGGTTIVLSRLKSKRIKLTAAAVRKRLARRFDVLDPTPRDKGGFKIIIDGEQLTHRDRQELKRLEFIWEFGSSTLPDQALPRGIKRFTLPNTIVDEQRGWSVRGWIGTAHKPSDLAVEADPDAGPLKNIMILARKRPIHDGILDKIDFSRVFGNYVTGQIEADFLDLDGWEDIATSDRQRLIEDDERVIALQKFLREALYAASEKWTEERPKDKATNAFHQYPQLKQWRDRLPQWQQKAANKMISTIAALPMEEHEEEQNRTALYRSGVLAFARIGIRENADQLEKLSEVTAEDLLRLLGAHGEYEAGLWVDILRGRVESIQQFENLTDANAKEDVLKKHLFHNLYLLDPAWERATEDKDMERALHKLEPGFVPTDDQGDEIKGRVDIKYRKAVGSHVIVELKRYERSVALDELFEQGEKYFGALQSVLAQRQHQSEGIEVIFVLGKPPRVTTASRFQNDEETISNRLGQIAGRYVLYDALIENARRQYAEYLKASRRASDLESLLASLDDIEGTVGNFM